MSNKKIVTEIFIKSSDSAKEIKESIDVLSSMKEDIEVYITFEFIFLFIHLISRELLKKFPDKRTEILNDIANTIIDTYIHVRAGSLSESERKSLRFGMCQKLEEAEEKYSKCTSVLDTENPLSDNGVFSLFAKNIATITNNEKSLNFVLTVTELALQSWYNIKLTLEESLNS
jgi:hypothetical protein